MSTPNTKIALEDGRGGLSVDLRTLVATCALVQGTRGTGKSYLARVIVEQSAPAGLQTIVIDPEGEYCTLREKCDVLIAGPRGDLPCSVKAAPLLARRLAELGVSAVIDLSEMKIGQAVNEVCDFVAAFLDAFDRLPRKLARPRLFVLDEAHKLCPESGKGRASSKDAVITLMSQGRKRGDGAILLTQRLAKLANDAAAEAGNIFIGRTSPIDLPRAQDLLGITAKDRESLRTLPSGHFYGTGPACSKPSVHLFQCRRAKTTHPEPGDRFKVAAPPPKRTVQKILRELELESLTDDPATEAETEAKRKSDTDKRVAELKRKLAAERRSRGVERTVLSGLAKRLRAAEAAVSAVTTDLAALAGRAAGGERPGAPAPATHEPDAVDDGAARKAPRSDAANGALGGGGIRRLMVTLAQHPGGIERTPLALYSHMSPKTGTLARYLSTLKAKGYARADGRLWFPQPAGVEALGGGWAPLPSGEALLEHWRAFVGNGGARRMFDALVDAGADGLSRDALAEASDLSASTGTFARYLSTLRSLQLAEGRSPIRIAEVLR